jgi:hypothetical protein
MYTPDASRFGGDMAMDAYNAPAQVRGPDLISKMIDYLHNKNRDT